MSRVINRKSMEKRKKTMEKEQKRGVQTTIGISMEAAEKLHACWLKHLNNGERISKKELMGRAIDLLVKEQ